MIKCIAIDDEPLALKQIEGYIKKTPFLELVSGFISALKALEYLLEHPVDLIFVDINMPDLNGIDFVKSLTSPPKVIFTTAYREYAVDGFQLDAADYLVKPIGYPEFLKATEKTKTRYFNDYQKRPVVKKNDNYLFIKSEYKIVRIEFNNIQYIEGMRDYVRIHLVNEKPIMTLLNMSKIMEYLPSASFMRIHRSFIVNLDKIQTIERNRIVFDKDIYIPVSEQYKDDFKKFLDDNFLL